MNNVLYIDTSNNDKIILSLYKNDSFCDLTKSIQKGNMSNELLTCVSKLLAKQKTEKKDIEAIVVYIGPGPYTSLRVGISSANAMAYVLNIPIFGINKDDTFQSALFKIRKNISKEKHFSHSINAYYQQAL